MSDLKYQSVEDLKRSKAESEKYIMGLQHKLNAEQQRLQWINKYIYEKTPKEMSVTEIERCLGHKIILKR